MKIHTDHLNRSHLVSALPAGCYLTIEDAGSRKRARAYKVWLAADPDTTDSYGVKRRYIATRPVASANRAATWQDWGDWLAELFALDPEAICGQYEGAGDFLVQTRIESERMERTDHPSGHAAEFAHGEWRATIAAARVEEERKLYPGECRVCGDIHGEPDEFGNSTDPETGICSNCSEEVAA